VENIIDDLYAGELCDYLKCIDIDQESERYDKFLDFALAIVPFGSIEVYMYMYMYLYVHIFIYVYTYICTYIYVYYIRL
jgi:hypothetical protein